MRQLTTALAPLALLSCLLCPASAGAQDREAPREIRWPSPDFPTLQSAVDALADGGTLRIAAGTFRLGFSFASWPLV